MVIARLVEESTGCTVADPCQPSFLSAVASGHGFFAPLAAVFIDRIVAAWLALLFGAIAEIMQINEAGPGTPTSP